MFSHYPVENIVWVNGILIPNGARLYLCYRQRDLPVYKFIMEER